MDQHYEMESEGKRIRLRDEFAMAALHRIVHSGLTVEKTAEVAYRYADAMMEARTK